MGGGDWAIVHSREAEDDPNDAGGALLPPVRTIAFVKDWGEYR